MRKITLLILPLLIIYFGYDDSFQRQKIRAQIKWAL
jgi:hypothetical protein